MKGGGDRLGGNQPAAESAGVSQPPPSHWNQLPMRLKSLIPSLSALLLVDCVTPVCASKTLTMVAPSFLWSATTFHKSNWSFAFEYSA